MNIATITLIGVSALLLRMAWIDYKTLLVPDSLNLLAWGGGVCVGSLTYGLIPTLEATFVMIGILTLLRFGVSFAFKKEAMGEADTMIVGTMGALLGMTHAMFALFLGACMALVALLASRNFHAPLPFVPFLVGGFFLDLFMGEHLLSLMRVHV